MKDGLVFRSWKAPTGDATIPQLLLPLKFRREVLHQLHNTVTAGHLGVSKMLGKVQEHFYWVNVTFRIGADPASQNGSSKKI